MRDKFWVRYTKNMNGQNQNILSSTFGGATWASVKGKHYYAMLVWGGK